MYKEYNYYCYRENPRTGSQNSLKTNNIDDVRDFVSCYNNDYVTVDSKKHDREIYHRNTLGNLVLDEVNSFKIDLRLKGLEV